MDLPIESHPLAWNSTWWTPRRSFQATRDDLVKEIRTKIRNFLPRQPRFSQVIRRRAEASTRPFIQGGMPRAVEQLAPPRTWLLHDAWHRPLAMRARLDPRWRGRGGIRIDGSRREISELHVLGHAFGEGGDTLFIRGHSERYPILKQKAKQASMNDVSGLRKSGWLQLQIAQAI